MSTDKSAAAARELVERWMGKKHPITMRSYVSDLTALISEHYYSKEKYDELLQQRDKLKEALERIADPIGYMMRNLKEGERLNGMMALQISGNAEYLKEIAEAAIKSTETK